jgi:phage gp29-like protein
MDKKQLIRIAKRVAGVRELASRTNDPRFYSAMNVLPNPDPILREIRQADKVYDAIMSDAHVIGEIRTMRAGLFNYKTKVVSGDDADSKANEAQELCAWWLKTFYPEEGFTWPDVFWNMGSAKLYGFRVHVCEWEIFKGHLLPGKIMDRPNRRFKFDIDNKLRLLTKNQPWEGEEAPSPYYVVTRHMPSHENPYGRALLSACYWPYTFKHGGLKFFFQYCERFGLPWPVGRYPAGTSISDQQELHDALIDLMESGAATIPDGDSVELIEVKGGGQKLAQESLIKLCNAEMSKALTSQTLATEMGEVGARAASETHKDRQDEVSESDRAIVEAGFNQLFTWITEFNFGDDIPPPHFEFFKPKEATESEVKTWKEAASVSDKVPLKAFHERLGIPMAEEGEPTLKVTSAPSQFPPLGGGDDDDDSAKKFARFCNHCGHVHTFANGDEHLDETQQQTDNAIAAHWIAPLAKMFADYEKADKSLKELRDDLPKFFNNLDDDQVNYIITQAMQLSFAEGVDQQQ